MEENILRRKMLSCELEHPCEVYAAHTKPPSVKWLDSLSRGPNITMEKPFSPWEEMDPRKYRGCKYGSCSSIWVLFTPKCQYGVNTVQTPRLFTTMIPPASYYASIPTDWYTLLRFQHTCLQCANWKKTNGTSLCDSCFSQDLWSLIA